MEAESVDRWQPIASGKSYDQVAVNVSHWGGGHDQSALRLTGKRCYSEFDFARATPSINWTYFDTERQCRRLDCNKLTDTAGITCFDYRWTAGGDDELRRYAEELVTLAPDVIMGTGS